MQPRIVKLGYLVPPGSYNAGISGPVFSQIQLAVEQLDLPGNIFLNHRCFEILLVLKYTGLACFMPKPNCLSGLVCREQELDVHVIIYSTCEDFTKQAIISDTLIRYHQVNSLCV